MPDFCLDRFYLIDGPGVVYFFSPIFLQISFCVGGGLTSIWTFYCEVGRTGIVFGHVLHKGTGPLFGGVLYFVLLF